MLKIKYTFLELTIETELKLPFYTVLVVFIFKTEARGEGLIFITFWKSYCKWNCKLASRYSWYLLFLFFILFLKLIILLWSSPSKFIQLLYLLINNQGSTTINILAIRIFFWLNVFIFFLKILWFVTCLILVFFIITSLHYFTFLFFVINWHS